MVKALSVLLVWCSVHCAILLVWGSIHCSILQSSTGRHWADVGVTGALTLALPLRWVVLERQTPKPAWVLLHLLVWHPFYLSLFLSLSLSLYIYLLYFHWDGKSIYTIYSRSPAHLQSLGWIFGRRRLFLMFYSSVPACSSCFTLLRLKLPPFIYLTPLSIFTTFYCANILNFSGQLLQDNETADPTLIIFWYQLLSILQLVCSRMLFYYWYI